MDSINEKTRKNSTKFVASIITILIIGLLILAGPAKAIGLTIDNFTNSAPVQGASISTNFMITINSNERISFPNPIGIFLDDSDSPLCSFSIDGSSSDCASKGITIVPISTTTDYGYGYGYNYGYGYDYGYGYGYDYGYGYGYGYGYQNGYSNGALTYRITFDTFYFSIGTHNVLLKLDLGNNYVYESNERDFTVIKASTSGRRHYYTQENPILDLLDSNENKDNNIIDLSKDEKPDEDKKDFTSFITGAIAGISDLVTSKKMIPIMFGIMILVFTLIISIISYKNKLKKIKK